MYPVPPALSSLRFRNKLTILNSHASSISQNITHSLGPKMSNSSFIRCESGPLPISGTSRLDLNFYDMVKICCVDFAIYCQACFVIFKMKVL